MNKKEQAQVQELKRKLSTLAALRWTDEVLPDLPIPICSPHITKGWETCYNRVVPSLSSSVYHKTDSWDEAKNGGWSQGPRNLYSTKLLALKALRHEKELQFAEELARIDLWIATEKGVTE